MNNVKELNTQKMQQIIGRYSEMQCIGTIGAGIGTGITGSAVCIGGVLGGVIASVWSQTFG